MKKSESILEDTAITEAPVMQGSLSITQNSSSANASSDETIHPFKFQASQAELDERKRIPT